MFIIDPQPLPFGGLALSDASAPVSPSELKQACGTPAVEKYLNQRGYVDSAPTAVSSAELAQACRNPTVKSFLRSAGIVKD